MTKRLKWRTRTEQADDGSYFETEDAFIVLEQRNTTMPQDKLPFPAQPVALAPEVQEYRARFDAHREKMQQHMNRIVGMLRDRWIDFPTPDDDPNSSPADANRLESAFRLLSNPAHRNSARVYYEGDGDGIYARVYAADWTPYSPWSGATVAIYRWEKAVSITLLGVERASVADARAAHTVNDVCMELAGALQTAWDTLGRAMLPVSKEVDG